MSAAPYCKEVTRDQERDVIAAITTFGPLPCLDGLVTDVVFVPDEKSPAFAPLRQVPMAGVVATFLNAHNEQADKRSHALIYGDCDTYRVAGHVRTASAIALDFDDGASEDEVIAALDAAGVAYTLYNSHSHGRTETRKTVEQVKAWLRKQDDYDEVTDESLSAYLGSRVTKWFFSRGKRDEQPTHIICEHTPLVKFRVVIYIGESIPIEGEGGVTWTGFKRLYMHVADRLLGPEIASQLDKSCNQPGRLFFIPAKPPGVELGHRIIHHDGALYDWRPAWAEIKQQVEDDARQAAERRAERMASGDYGADLDSVRACLTHIAADDYDVWIRVIAAIHHESGGSDDGHALAHEWSATSDKYDEDAVQRLFESFDGAESDRPATLGTLVHLARESCPEFRLPSSAKADEDRRVALCRALGLDPSALAAPDNDDDHDDGVRNFGGGVTDDALKQAVRIDHREPFVNWEYKDSHGGTAEQVIDVLVRADAKNPKLFRMGQRLARIQYDGRLDETRAVPMTQAALRTEIDQRCDFVRVTKDKSGGPLSVNVNGTNVKMKHGACPDAIAENIYNRQELPFPQLIGIATAPFFDKGGNLVSERGYHEGSGYYLATPRDFAMEPVPAVPSPDDVARAKALLDEAICNFPFNDGDELNERLGRGAASKATWLAKLIQPFMRAMINGPCPMYLTQKPKPRTGAGKLANVHSLIAFGNEAAMEGEKATPDEYQKTLLTHLQNGSRHIFFDNLHKRLDSADLASVVTSTVYRGRKLQTNELISEPVTQLIEVAGNNVQLSDELRERTLLTTLNAEIEDPGARPPSSFKHPMLESWVRENRGQLVWAVLTLIQSWIAAGRPEYVERSLGMFEAYCRSVGGVLQNAGIVGFMENRHLLKESVGDESGTIKSFVQVWWHQFGDKSVKLGSLPFDAAPDDYAMSDTSEAKGVETLNDLLLVHSGEIDLGFNSYRKTGWQRELGKVLTGSKDQTFTLEDGASVRLNYGRSNGGNRGQLVRLPQ